MAAKGLQEVEVAMQSVTFQNTIAESFGSSSTTLDAADCNAKAAKTLLRLREVLLQNGLRIAELRKQEQNAFIRRARTTAQGSFTSDDYKALLETLTKYAALKARHNNGKRWGLGLGLSAAGAMALTAAVFTSAGLVLVAAPAGAAIGAVAVAADGSKARRRDRRTAEQASSSSSSTSSHKEPSADDATAEIETAPAADNATAAEVETAPAAEAPAGPLAEEEPAAARAATVSESVPKAATMTEHTAAPAAGPKAAAVAAVLAAPAVVAVAPPAVPAPAAPGPVTSSGNSSPRGSSEELVSAVVDLMPAPPAADSGVNAAAAAFAERPAPDAISTTAADAGSDVPAPVVCDSPFTAASRDTSGSHPSHLPMGPLAIQTSGSNSWAMSGSGVLSGSGAALPPKPLKKSKSLKKTMKSIKKAFSLKDKDSSSDTRRKDTGADSDSPLAPPVPRRSGSFFRRSSSDIMCDESVEGVEVSKGSATIKRMVEGIRRSFSLDRPSVDLVRPKKARKEESVH